MTEIWVKIKGYKNYSISNKGRVRNDKFNWNLKPFILFNKSNLLYIQLSKNGKCSGCLGIHTLVAKHFNKMKPKDTTAIHLNYIQYDNREPNVEGATIGAAIVRTRRYNADKKNRLKGIFKWSYYSKKKGKTLYTWRAMLSTNDTKVKTVGYFATRKEAIIAYYKAYKELNGTTPFRLNKYV